MSKLKRIRYAPISKQPVARFYYQGSHSHPVRRTVLIIENRPNMLIGYEFREGSVVRSMNQALVSIKSYRKDKIANWGDYSRLQQSSENRSKDPDESTLERYPLAEIFSDNV